MVGQHPAAVPLTGLESPGKSQKVTSGPVPSANQESGAQIRDERHDESAALIHCQDDV